MSSFVTRVCFENAPGERVSGNSSVLLVHSQKKKKKKKRLTVDYMGRVIRVRVIDVSCL